MFQQTLVIQLAEKRRHLVQQAEKRRRLVQQTEKRRCVSAWSLVHLAEKGRNRQKKALCIVTHGPAAGALLSLSPALTKGNIPVALKNARSYSFSGADFLTSGERLLRKF